MTQTQTPPTLLHPALTQQSFFRLSVADYREMGERGILTPEDRVELLDGYLVVKPMQNSPHASTLDRIAEDLDFLKAMGWRVREQMPVTLSESVPEPDIALARGDRHTYSSRHPTPGDIGLIVEVSDSTLRMDREVKQSVYAKDGIVCYWIINLEDRQVEVHTRPDPSLTPTAYAVRTVFKPGDAVPVILDGSVVMSVAVTDLLP